MYATSGWSGGFPGAIRENDRTQFGEEALGKASPTINHCGRKKSLLIHCYSLFLKVIYLDFGQNYVTARLFCENSLLISLLSLFWPGWN